jgi:dihydroorotase|tara:strand:- start:3011 stop:4294 length:1284 start_codon:yes stop_codon:yes gene_type:complete
MDRVADLLIEDGRVNGIDDQISPPDGAAVIDAAGLVVCPGFVDLHCHLREPGLEYKETVATGTRAAAKGGFTTVCAMPNTVPTMDTRATVDYVLQKARTEGAVRVLPIGCVTKGSLGKELAEMGELAEAGCIGFSDDGNPVADPNIMRQALSYSSALGLPIINHCETPELFRGGHMNEGWVSNRLGIRGAPNSAEETMVSRDISLAEMVGGRIHIAHISTAGAVEMVRQAKERGIAVTCEVTPHHLTLTDEAVMGRAETQNSPYGALTSAAYDTTAKVNPPLRATPDMQAMVAALADGVIDFVATDHAPHSSVEKLSTFEEAAFGISVLETALGSMMTLVHAGQLPLATMIEKMTSAPTRFLGRTDLGTLKPGAAADVAIFDPNAEWVVDADAFISRGKNSPLHGATLNGAVVATLVGGETAFSTSD